MFRFKTKSGRLPAGRIAIIERTKRHCVIAPDQSVVMDEDTTRIELSVPSMVAGLLAKAGDAKRALTNQVQNAVEKACMGLMMQIMPRACALR
jgi:hypothetical protein